MCEARFQGLRPSQPLTPQRPKRLRKQGACWLPICSVSEVQAQRSCHHKAAQLEAIGVMTYIYPYRTICMASSVCLCGSTSTNCTALCSREYPKALVCLKKVWCTWINFAGCCATPQLEETFSCCNLWNPDFDSLHDFPPCICLWWMFYAWKQKMLIREIVWNLSPLCMLIIITARLCSNKAAMVIQ